MYGLTLYSPGAIMTPLMEERIKNEDGVSSKSEGASFNE